MKINRYWSWPHRRFTDPAFAGSLSPYHRPAFFVPQFRILHSALCFASFWYSLYSLNNDENMTGNELYATSALIGGIGLDAVALKTLPGRAAMQLHRILEPQSRCK